MTFTVKYTDLANNKVFRLDHLRHQIISNESKTKSSYDSFMFSTHFNFIDTKIRRF